MRESNSLYLFPKQVRYHYANFRLTKLVPPDGIEPPLKASKAPVLPLYEGGIKLVGSPEVESGSQL